MLGEHIILFFGDLMKRLCTWESVSDTERGLREDPEVRRPIGIPPPPLPSAPGFAISTSVEEIHTERSASVYSVIRSLCNPQRFVDGRYRRPFSVNALAQHQRQLKIRGFGSILERILTLGVIYWPLFSLHPYCCKQGGYNLYDVTIMVQWESVLNSWSIFSAHAPDFLVLR